MTQRIAVYGGSFDPFHTGHLVPTVRAQETFKFDAVHFVPAGKPPHKLGEPLTGNVRLRNASGETRPAGPGGRVKLAYHWLDESGEMVEFEGARTAFEGPVEPGARVALAQPVLPPAEPGRYRLQVDLVYEFVGWFSERGASVCEAEVEVLGAPGEASSSQSER